MTIWQIALIVLLVIVCALYLVAIPLAKRSAMRKQTKMVDQMHANLKPGDQIVLIDGIVGKIKRLNQEDVQVEIAANTVITVKRMGIAGVVKEAATGDRNELDHVHSAVESATASHG